MPTLTNSVPKYRKHKASGQAVVTIGGVDHYLGPHGTKASLVEYDRLIGEWIANGRQPVIQADAGHTIAELLSRYRRFVQQHYVKNGRPTDEQGCIASAMRVLRERYANTPAREFGPLALKSIMGTMVERGWSRKYVNKSVDRIRRFFRWAVGEQLLAPSVLQALQAVDGLRRGKTIAAEPPPIAPVDDATVEATLAHLRPAIADMVRLQRLCGMRPGEVCQLRPCDIDRSGEVWGFTPQEHKTEHAERRRIILIGPRGQEILRPYLLRPAESYCFEPLSKYHRIKRDSLNSRG